MVLYSASDWLRFCLRIIPAQALGAKVSADYFLYLFLAELYGVIKFAVLSYEFRDAPVPPLPEGAVEIHVRLWPAYLIGLVAVSWCFYYFSSL